MDFLIKNPEVLDQIIPNPRLPKEDNLLEKDIDEKRNYTADKVSSRRPGRNLEPITNNMNHTFDNGR